MSIVNLGSGRSRKRTGQINVDCLPGENVDVVCDLDVFPWPLDDNCAEEIIAKHILEHLSDLPRVMDECWRIIKPGGVMNIEVPDAANIRLTWSDPTHVRPFTKWTWDYFTAEGLKKRPYCKHAWAIVFRQIKQTDYGNVWVVVLMPEGK